MSYVYLGTRCLYLEYAEYFFPRIVKARIKQKYEKISIGNDDI
jgi:hypothetical protein